MTPSRAALPIASVALAVLLALQLKSYFSAPPGFIPDEYESYPILSNSSLPLPLVPITGESAADLPCRFAFVVDPDCYYCRNLAERASEFDGEGSGAAPLWLSVSSISRSEWFAKNFALSDVYRFDVPGEPRPVQVMRQIDIPVVPTRLVFDSEGRVVDIRITQSTEAPGFVAAGCPG